MCEHHIHAHACTRVSSHALSRMQALYQINSFHFYNCTKSTQTSGLLNLCHPSV